MPGISDLYIDHINNAIEGHNKHHTIKEISRVLVESQLITEMNNGKFPVEYKIAWTHAVLYTNEFDSLWTFAARQYKLPDSCLERLKPDASLCKYDLPQDYQPDPMNTTGTEAGPSSPAQASSPVATPGAAQVRSQAAATKKRKRPAATAAAAVAAPITQSGSASPLAEAEEHLNPYAKPKAKSYRRPRGAPSPKGRSLPRRSPASAAKAKENAKARGTTPIAPERVIPTTLTEENVCGVVESGSEDENRAQAAEESEEEPYDPSTDPANIARAAQLGEKKWVDTPRPEGDQSLTRKKFERKRMEIVPRQRTQQEIEDDELFASSSSESESDEDGDGDGDDSGVAGLGTRTVTPKVTTRPSVGLRGGGETGFEGLDDDDLFGDREFSSGIGREWTIDQGGLGREEGEKGKKSAMKKRTGSGGSKGRNARFNV